MFELGIQKNWIDALYARSSVRQYTGAPDKEQLDRLGETCRKLSWQGVKIRMFKGPGLKSQIKGTDVYAVIIAKRGTPMEVEGFMGEALVLEATAMGLVLSKSSECIFTELLSGYHQPQRRFADG